MARTVLRVDFPPITVPSDFLVHVAKQAEADVEAIVGPDSVRLADARTAWSSQAIGGLYPDASKYMELEPSQSLVLDRQALLGSLKRMMILESDNAAIRITRDGETVLLWTSHSEVGELDDRINGSGSFNDQVWFNSRILYEAIDAHDTDEVTFKLDTPSEPVVLRGANITQVVMPLVVHS